MKEEIRSPALKIMNRAVYASLPDGTPDDFSEILKTINHDSISLMGRFSVNCCPGGEFQEAGAEALDAALQLLTELREECSGARVKLYSMAHKLISISFTMATAYTIHLHEQQSKHMRPLVQKSRAANSNQEVARKLASDMWAHDAGRQFRTTDMADKVYRAMAKMELEKPLPDTLERVKQWIRPVAPDYAKKGGPSKKPERS